LPQIDLDRFRRIAARNKGPLIAFLRKLDEIVPEDFSRLVKEKDKEAWSTVDCVECANCCKTMTPTYNRADLIRIARHFGMTVAQFKAKWLKQDEDNGDWVNVQQPCQFLRSDNLCGIYEVRPKDCAEFPHHNKKPFDDYNDTFVGNVPRCPATYELVKRLKFAVEKDWQW
jgi:Fe-S-cluster containining protein